VLESLQESMDKDGRLTIVGYKRSHRKGLRMKMFAERDYASISEGSRMATEIYEDLKRRYVEIDFDSSDVIRDWRERRQIST
jgi:hypothetical protein